MHRVSGKAGSRGASPRAAARVIVGRVLVVSPFIAAAPCAPDVRVTFTRFAFSAFAPKSGPHEPFFLSSPGSQGLRAPWALAAFICLRNLPRCHRPALPGRTRFVRLLSNSRLLGESDDVQSALDIVYILPLGGGNLQRRDTACAGALDFFCLSVAHSEACVVYTVSYSAYFGFYVKVRAGHFVFVFYS